MRGGVHTLAVLIRFGYAKALPRAAHEFLRRATVEAGLPDGLIASVVEIDRTVALHVAHDGGFELCSRASWRG